MNAGHRALQVTGYVMFMRNQTEKRRKLVTGCVGTEGVYLLSEIHNPSGI